MKCEECKHSDKTERICYYMGENRCADNEEQTEDAISRQATVERLCKVAEFMNEKRDGLGSPYVMAALFIQDNKDEFPSVTPKQRTGHNCNEDYADCDQFVCSECGIELQDWCRIERDEDDGKITCHEYVMKYCPNCGTRMVEPQESEDNEDIPMEYFESGGC